MCKNSIIAKLEAAVADNEMLWRLHAASVNFRQIERFDYSDDLFRDSSRRAFRETILMEEEGR